jgi:hypothetical protein
VAVGYMDPGNWATSLAGGSQFGYALLSVVLVSNLMAMLFQAAAVRLGIGAGLDLAQACRRHFSPRASLLLWILCEIAIVACNLAEVIGMAIGLNLLFGLPLVAGVVVTLLDVLCCWRFRTAASAGSRRPSSPWWRRSASASHSRWRGCSRGSPRCSPASCLGRASSPTRRCCIWQSASSARP